MSERIDFIVKCIKEELAESTEKYGPFASPHEGYAVILEETDELFDLIKDHKGDNVTAVHECLQISAMAIRYIIDVCQKAVGDNGNENGHRENHKIGGSGPGE